jgi:PadR family transcriptional regulator AphA
VAIFISVPSIGCGLADLSMTAKTLPAAGHGRIGCYMYQVDIYQPASREKDSPEVTNTSSNSKRPRNKSRYAVLGMLSMGLETGYQMKKHVEQHLGHFWTESYGQIYPILRQLLEEGLVTRRSEALSGKPRRNLYRLTKEGSDELLLWLGEAPESQPPRLELLLKFSFGARVRPQVCIEHLQRHRELCENDLETLSAIEKTLCDSPDGLPDQPYWLMTLRYGKAIRAAERSWCDESLEYLREIEAEDEAKKAAIKRRASL